MRIRALVGCLLGGLALAGCGSQTAASVTVTVSVPKTIVSQSTATVVSTVTYDPAAASSSSAAASASSVAAAGGAEFQAQMSAAGLTYPIFESAKGHCANMDAGKEPFNGYIGSTLNFDTTVSLASARDLQGLQITINTLCPQHQAGLYAAIQKKATASSAASAATEARNQVSYSVTGDSGSALITYTEDANFNIAQENGAALPWTKELTIPAGEGRILSLSAQNSGGGEISCSISVGGQVVDTATSSGDYAIVTCAY